MTILKSSGRFPSKSWRRTIHPAGPQTVIQVYLLRGTKCERTW